MASGRSLFYWPKDFTFVCPTEIIGYGELKSDFADRDAVLIGASTDTDFVHFAWRKSDERLAAADFPWIADNKKELAERARHPRPGRGRRLPRDLHRRSGQCHPARHGQRPQRRPQPAGDAARARRAADRRALPVQLARGRGGAPPGGLSPPAGAERSRTPRRGRGATARRLRLPAPLSHLLQGDAKSCRSRHFADTLPDYAKDHPAQRRLAAQRPDARRPAQIRAAARPARTAPATGRSSRRPRPKSAGKLIARGGQCGARGRGGDGDEQCLLPLRPPRLEPGIWHACRPSCA